MLYFIWDMGFSSTASNPSFVGHGIWQSHTPGMFSYKQSPGLDTLGLKLRLGFDQASNPQLKLSWGLFKKKPIYRLSFF